MNRVKKILLVIIILLSCIFNAVKNIYAEVYGSISGKVVNVDTGEPAKGIGITIDVLVKLLAGKNITDLNILIKKVYGTISGKILHQDNTPFNEKEVYIESYTTEGKSADRDGTIIKENGLFKLNLLKDSPVWNLIISYPGWSTTGYRNAQYKYPQTIDTRGAKDIKDILIYPSFDTSYGLIANVYDTSNNKYGKNGIEVVLLHKNIYGDTEYSISCFTDEFGKVYFKGVLPEKYYIELCKYIIIEKVSKVSGKKRKTEGYKRYKYPGTIEIRYDSLKQRDLIYNENKAVEEESANFSMKCNSVVFFAQGDGADFANDCIKGCVDKTKDKCIQAKGKEQKVEKIIGPATIKIDKCTTPKKGDIIGVFTITEMEKESKCCIEEKKPAIVINKYGEGKTIYFTIDLLKSYETKTKGQIREIVLNSITQVTPEGTIIATGNRLPGTSIEW